VTSVIFCTPTIEYPFPAYQNAMERSVPELDAAGITHQLVCEVGSAYISWARSNMLHKAMKTDADAVVFLDHDLSWEPEDLIRLIRHPGDVVSGDYRFKKDEEEYMGRLVSDDDGRPVVRADGTISAHAIPAGFLKVTRAAVERFSNAYPELVYGPEKDFVDLFNHGAHEGLWWGEDYAFSRRWRAMGEEIYLIPDLNITHHTRDKGFTGNLHEFMLKQPGGSKAA